MLSLVMLQKRSVLLVFFSFLFLLGNMSIGQVTPSTKDTLLNTAHYLITGTSKGSLLIIKKENEGKFPSYKILTKYEDDLILGENISIDEVDIYRKYEPIESFDDYHVDVFNEKLAPANFDTNPVAKNFITRIKAACEEGINFAGHFTLVEWGCGTACQSGVLVDRKTGKIFDYPTTSLGSDFKKDSNLIIRNIGAVDSETNLIWISGHSEVKFELWDGENFRSIN
jgi:hypothetical protein